MLRTEYGSRMRSTRLHTERSRKLRLPALVFAVMLMITAVPTTAAEDEELYLQALNGETAQIETNTNITTTKVTKGLFEINGTCRANLDFPNVYYVVNEINASKVTFLEYKVSNGSRVKKGDIIAAVNTSVEDVQTEELEVRIQTEEESLEQYIDTNKALLKEYQDKISGAASEAQRRTAQLLYDRLSVSYENERVAREENLEHLRNTYNSYFEQQGTQYILAPDNGVVSGLQRYRSGETINNYAYICAVYDTSSVSVRVNGGSELLYFNMPVTVAQGSGENMVTCPGRVTSCKSTTLTANLIGSNDYVELLGDTSVFNVGEEVTLRFKTVHMEDVLLVPNKAVKTDTSGTYVFKYVNGLCIKRYILIGGNNPDVSWVVDGLDEGDVVVIK